MLGIPIRNKNSHKGEHGKVLIIAGSKKYYGAPIFNALGAEMSGADLITLYLPDEHIECAKSYSLNLFINGFVKGNLGLKDLGLIIEEIKKNHVLLIGSGLDRDADTVRVVQLILENCEIPVVIDADALLPEILQIKRKSEWVITPHKGEFARLFGARPEEDNIKKSAQEHNLVILLKSATDVIADANGNVYLNFTGCPEMRVGGTGDALAGIIASFIAQGMPIYEATKSATHYFGLCGEDLAKKQRYFSTKEIIMNFPVYLSKLNQGS